MTEKLRDNWEDQSLTEQATEILRYIDADPRQALVPGGRVELLRRTLAATADAPPCLVCADVLKQLRGHPDSKLDGDGGLAAATMRDVDRLKGDACWIPQAAPKLGTNVPNVPPESMKEKI